MIIIPPPSLVDARRVKRHAGGLPRQEFRHECERRGQNEDARRVKAVSERERRSRGSRLSRRSAFFMARELVFATTYAVAAGLFFRSHGDGFDLI